MALRSVLPDPLPRRWIDDPGVPSRARESARTRGEDVLRGKQRSLFYGLVVFVIIVSLPGKFLFYLAPAVLLSVSLVTVPLVSVPRLILLYAGAFGLSLVSVLIDQLEGAQVNFPGLLLAALTYASTFILLAPALSFRPKQQLAVAMVRVCAVFMTLQGLISIAQFAATGDGDYVSGSYGLFDFLSASKTISQVNLSFTLFCVIVFMLPYTRSVRWTPIALCIGLMSCGLAQSGHQTIFFLVALPAATLRGFRLRGAAPALGIVVLTMTLVLVFYPDTFTLAESWIKKEVLADDSLKRAIVESGFGRLAESWKNSLLGLGFGQYTSRASLFAAGFQNSVPLPAALRGASHYFTTDVLPLILLHEHMGEGSAIAKPYFSVMSVLVEVGPLVSIGLLWVVVREFRALTRRSREATWEEEGSARYCKFFVIFLTLNCFVENYLELLQAIAIPMALYAVARGRLRTLAAEQFARRAL